MSTLFPKWQDNHGSEHGWIYVALPRLTIIGQSVPPCYKIGMTTRTSTARSKEWWKVGFLTVCRWPMRGPNDEIDIHDNLRRYRVKDHPRQNLDAVAHREIYVPEQDVYDYLQYTILEHDGTGRIRYAKGYDLPSVLAELDEIRDMWMWWQGDE